MRQLAAVFVTVATGCALLAQEAAVKKQTFAFKTVGDLKIEADVYRRSNAELQPVLVWIHGGALISGSRNSVPKDLLDLCASDGYCLVSIDYRLAPEVKVPAIIADVQDAFRWIRNDGPRLFHADPKRLVVSGGSAGGYLTMMTGIAVEPRPTALVAYWGYGDVDGDWYTKPSEHYRKTRALVSKEEAYGGLDGKVTSGAVTKEQSQARGRYYLYLRQNGLWTKEVTGFDPQAKTELNPFCPVRNITPRYPPILMVHGTADTDVPHQLSADMARELARHQVPHELVSVQGAEHGLAGGDQKAVAEARRKAVEFIRQYLQRK